MAEKYGWTPDQIDEVDRHRVYRWWAVQDVHRLANEYLQKVQGGFQQTMQSRNKLRDR